jgi:hypothetical protein
MKPQPVVLTPRDQEKIDTLAAHFVESSEELIALSRAITETVIRHIVADQRRMEESWTENE